ncbi:chorismate mutase [Paracoccus binzhouensis]|uniref:chorismate mutase n=1 Tax=Paracoccus binzhouensis TaxID=2796149 RepID=UPI0018EF1980|nr:chorismate mutase [Paracoccus binzhouensis]
MSLPAVAPEDLAPDLVPPEAVAGLGEVRRGIDLIDARIVALLGLRLRYVLAAADFKPDIASIPAPDRVRQMLDQRAAWAAEAGLSPDFIGPLFGQLAEWFIRQQIVHWREHRAGRPAVAAPTPTPAPAPAPPGSARGPGQPALDRVQSVHGAGD